MTSKVRVLVADDNPFSAELLHDHLESLGYAVDLAADGNRALIMASSGDYQLVLLDVNMPVYNGVQVVQMLHERPPPHPIKVIVITADRMATRQAELSRYGIDAYFTKPINLARLSELVKVVLQARRP